MNCYGHNFLDYMSFGSPKMTYCPNTMIYHNFSIENICCHQPPSQVTQCISIYDHIRVLPIIQSLLLILAHIQYPLKVESSCNIVIW